MSFTLSQYSTSKSTFATPISPELIDYDSNNDDNILNNNNIDIKLKNRYKLDDGRTGICVFVGNLPFTDGIWIGLKIENGNGNTNGIIYGKQYFKCKNNNGLFIRKNKIIRDLGNKFNISNININLDDSIINNSTRGHSKKHSNSMISPSISSPLHLTEVKSRSFDTPIIVTKKPKKHKNKSKINRNNSVTISSNKKKKKLKNRKKFSFNENNVKNTKPQSARARVRVGSVKHHNSGKKRKNKKLRKINTQRQHSHSETNTPTASTKDSQLNTPNKSIFEALNFIIGGINDINTENSNSEYSTEYFYNNESLDFDQLLFDKRQRQDSLGVTFAEAMTIPALNPIKHRMELSFNKWKPPKYNIIDDDTPILASKLLHAKHHLDENISKGKKADKKLGPTEIGTHISYIIYNILDILCWFDE